VRRNGVSCITIGDREHDEVKKWHNFNTEGGCQYIE